jgi:signal transduction histidine kinase
MNINEYVNTRVRARGVLAFDAGETPQLLVPSPRFLEIKESSPADPFAVPTFSIGALADLDERPERRRCMKVTGVVTHVGRKSVFVQDDSGATSAMTIEQPQVRVGDTVEVVGFPTGHSPVIMSEALVRRTGTGNLPVPLNIPPDVAEMSRYAGLLVQLEGLVLEQRASLKGQVLSLQMGRRVLEAALGKDVDRARRLHSIPVGSRVAITGVCQVYKHDAFEGAGEQLQDVSIPTLRVWLRTPADVAVLQRPPWWTWKHSVAVVGVCACGLLGALVWVRTLRHRVTQRTRDLQQTTGLLEKEIQTSAVLAERDRLAGEIHDSVEQGLAAIMLQLDAAAKQVHNPEVVRRCVGMARRMAGFSRTEVEHAVWDLQSPLLQNTDLSSALKHVASEIGSGNSAQVRVTVVGQARPVSSSIEHHLLRIGQEAITNAVKHAQPANIEATLEYSDREVRLSVKDDGRGFDTAAILKQNRIGHFGLQGIRARTRKTNGELTVSSRPGQGTTITVTVALNSSANEKSNEVS